MSNIDTIWQMCTQAYLQIGNRKLAFPAQTDRTKTYQWRFLERLNNKFTEWKFTDALKKEYIEAAVTHAKQYKLLDKGLALLHQSNIMKLCYKHVTDKVQRVENSLDTVIRVRKFLVEQMPNGITYKGLLHRQSIGSATNLTRWYQAGHLPALFIAISRSCGLAVSELAKSDINERKVLPNDSSLFILRHTFLGEPGIKLKLRSILQDDWRVPCQ